MDTGTREVALDLEDIMEKLRNAFPSTRDKELCGMYLCINAVDIKNTVSLYLLYLVYTCFY